MAKQYYIDDHITMCYPYETSCAIKRFGVLDMLVGKRMSRDAIDRVICELVTRHPYVSGSMSLKLRVMWEDGNTRGYYHIFDFSNDRHGEQDKEPLPAIRYEQ